MRIRVAPWTGLFGAALTMILAFGVGGAAFAATDSKSSKDPRPKEAVGAILAAFDHFPIVAIGMSHWQQTESDFALSVIRDPRFPSKVNDIVLECGNSLYQDVLDRYIAGQSVPEDSLQRVWRDTTQPGRGDNGQTQQLVDEVRVINRHLPPSRRLRVLAGDSPIDWGKIQTPDDLKPFGSRRDVDFASVVDRQVLSKRRKGLLVIGAAHVLRRPVSWRDATVPPDPTVTMLLEQRHPGSTFIIVPHDRFEDHFADFEARFAAWPKPGLATVRDTWLGSVTGGALYGGNIRRVGSDPTKVDDPYPGLRLQDLADAYLYLGPISSLARAEFAPPTPGSDYARELDRRNQLMGGMPVAVPAPSAGG